MKSNQKGYLIEKCIIKQLSRSASPIQVIELTWSSDELDHSKVTLSRQMVTYAIEFFVKHKLKTPSLRYFYLHSLGSGISTFPKKTSECPQASLQPFQKISVLPDIKCKIATTLVLAEVSKTGSTC